MASCLAKLSQDKLPDERRVSASQRLRELVVECSSLLVITLMSNPSMYEDLQHCKLDEGIVCHDALPLTHYSNVLVSSCMPALPALGAAMLLHT